jgi:hypothetical protein
MCLACRLSSFFGGCFDGFAAVRIVRLASDFVQKSTGIGRTWLAPFEPGHRKRHRKFILSSCHSHIAQSPFFVDTFRAVCK